MRPHSLRVLNIFATAAPFATGFIRRLLGRWPHWFCGSCRPCSLPSTFRPRRGRSVLAGLWPRRWRMLRKHHSCHYRRPCFSSCLQRGQPCLESLLQHGCARIAQTVWIIWDAESFDRRHGLGFRCSCPLVSLVRRPRDLPRAGRCFPSTHLPVPIRSPSHRSLSILVPIVLR